MFAVAIGGAYANVGRDAPFGGAEPMSGNVDPP